MKSMIVHTYYIYRFYKEDDGAVTIFTVIIFAFLMAFAGLVFDVGRIYNVHSQSQSYVDQVALAAAAELDGSVGSIERAIRAAVGDAQHGALLNEGHRFSLSGDNNVGVQSMMFLDTIANDPNPGVYSPVAGDNVLCTYQAGAVWCDGVTQAEADTMVQFVLVNSTTETEDFILFPIAGVFIPGFRTEASVAPQALAGFTRNVCNFPPMSICNPYESQTPPYGGEYIPQVGQQILLKSKGSGSQWAPGDFGFLNPAAGAGGGLCGSPNGTSFLRCVLGLVEPNTQCVSAQVDIKPGQAVSAHVGLNMRFDIYDPPLTNAKNDPNFAPSANVTKGKTHNPNQCRLNQLETPPVGYETVPLPRDSCFYSATCQQTGDGSPRLGNGITTPDLQTYWLTNHGVALPGALVGGTRYDVYRYEINNSMIPDKSPQGEDGNATCASTSISDPLRDRRIMIMAVINCLEHDIRGSASDVPVEAFVRMFLTEPVGLDGSSTEDIYAETLGVVNPGDFDGVLHDFPVLYR